LPYSFPKVANQQRLTKFIIGQNFFGRISSVLVMRHSSSEKLAWLAGCIAGDVDSETQVLKLTKALGKLMDKLFLFFSPYFYSEGSFFLFSPNCREEPALRSGEAEHGLAGRCRGLRQPAED